MTVASWDGGLIAILRGVRPEEVLDVAAALKAGGFTTVEVPLNSPQPLRSIERLTAAPGLGLQVGAGTVLTADDARRVAGAGARLMLTPNLDVRVIQAGKACGLHVMPGVATPSEAFAAIAAGADALKLFPAEMLGPPVLKAWRAVLAPGTRLVPVGGVAEHNLAAFKAAGAAGAGIGSALYTPGLALPMLQRRAEQLLQIWCGR